MRTGAAREEAAAEKEEHPEELATEAKPREPGTAGAAIGRGKNLETEEIRNFSGREKRERITEKNRMKEEDAEP